MEKKDFAKGFLSGIIAVALCVTGGKSISIDPNYGYLFWLGKDWYACRGYGGQRIHIFPEKNMIIVMQATPTSRGMVYDDLIWKIKEL